MNIFDMLGGQDSRQIEALSRQFGLDPEQTRAALEQLAPVVAAGMRRQAESPEGLGALLNSLARGTAGGLSAPGPDGVRGHGNDILGQIFGDPDVSRGVAQQISGQTGIGAQILKQMLPFIAMMVAGSLLKKMFTGGGHAAPAPQPAPPQPHGGGLGDILADILSGGAGRGQQPPPGQNQSGGGFGDILSDILGGGSPGGQRPASPQRAETDQLRDILSDILTGQRGGAPAGQRPMPRQEMPPREEAPQQMPRGDGGIGDILREILGGAPPQNAPQPPRPAEPQRPQARNPLDEIFGPGTSSGSAADDLLNSVERRLGRRR